MQPATTVYAQRIALWMALLDLLHGTTWPEECAEQLDLERYRNGIFKLEDLRRATALRLVPALTAGVNAALIIHKRKEP